MVDVDDEMKQDRDEAVLVEPRAGGGVVVAVLVEAGEGRAGEPMDEPRVERSENRSTRPFFAGSRVAQYSMPIPSSASIRVRFPPWNSKPLSQTMRPGIPRQGQSCLMFGYRASISLLPSTMMRTSSMIVIAVGGSNVMINPTHIRLYRSTAATR